MVLIFDINTESTNNNITDVFEISKKTWSSVVDFYVKN